MAGTSRRHREYDRDDEEDPQDGGGLFRIPGIHGDTSHSAYSASLTSGHLTPPDRGSAPGGREPRAPNGLGNGLRAPVLTHKASPGCIRVSGKITLLSIS